MVARSKNKLYKCVAAALSVVMGSTVFLACAAKESPAPHEIAQGKALSVVDGVAFDYDNIFFDDFTGGVNKDYWYIGKMAWGSNGNGGVVPENVNYTDDGVLVLTGNGEYYTAGDVRSVGSRRDGTLTGAALISKGLFGAGRYEVKMKVLPRLGACTAFWTFAFDNEHNYNHEIDIELPGGTRSHNISFENILNTNYTTEGLNLSNDVNISAATGGAIQNFADGEWHTFGFDWYTLEPGEEWYPALYEDTNAILPGALTSEQEELTDTAPTDDEPAEDDDEGEDTSLTDGQCGKVVYFVDGIVTSVNDIFVPFYQTRLWLGVWFPNNSGFVGDAKFETDNMYVDWVRYTPFAGQPLYRFSPTLTGDVATDAEYPSAPVSTAKVNKIANGDCEFVQRGATNSGWEYNKRGIYDSESDEIIKMMTEENELKANDPSSYPGYVPLTKSEIKQKAKAAISVLRAVPAEECCSALTGIGYKSSCGLKVEQLGLIGQFVDSIYGGTNIDLSFKCKGKGALTVVYYGNGQTTVGERRIDFDSADWVSKLYSICVPDGTKRIELQLTSAYDGAAYFDELELKVL